MTEIDGTAGVDDTGRIVVYLNKNVKMTPGKAAAQAAHAVLTLMGVHPEFPVIVLRGSKTRVESMEATVKDAGRTEVAPGTLTAGASFEFSEAGVSKERQRLNLAYETYQKAKKELEDARQAYFDAPD